MPCTGRNKKIIRVGSDTAAAILEASMMVKASGRVRLPLTWHAVCIEEHEEGTVIYAEHRGLVSILGELIERLMDRVEEPIRKTVWPYIGGKK